MTGQPDPQLTANLSRLTSASERFVEAARSLPPPRVLKKEVAGWAPKRLDKLGDLLSGVLIAAEELAGLLEAERARRAEASTASSQWRRGQGAPRVRPGEGAGAAAADRGVESPRPDDRPKC